MKTMIEIHALQNFAPSNLNRDDTGAPKDALFGGTRRARVSSQCLKRAVRQYFKELVEQKALTSNDVAFRTKRLLDALIEHLVNKGRVKEEANKKACLALAAMELAVKEDGKSEYLLFLGQREISSIANIIHEKWDSITASETAPVEGKRPGKAKKQAAQSADPELKKALDKVFNGGKALDVALFGRMLADMPEKNQNAACQVAHAISTHSVEREFDFYTAVDDRKPEDTAGADMMGTIEFNSACFYRYAVVDWGMFVKNLQDDTELAEKGLRAFLEGFMVAEPTGKQNTFAAHNPPEFITVSVRRNTAPRNLANAFETAVYAKGKSLTKESADRLSAKAVALDKLYGTKANSRYAVAEDVFGKEYKAEGLGEKLESIPALIKWALDEVSKKEEE
ncbi:MAG: type I-E CRISPR-associated protein Cas7/Cse4/CasC [Syntrophobacterales bacterium CG_4_8_14_3_um_filter_49_14]|nr:MAG: type I-E CRISPR-associated protein Cas7/Cse4/CasC [Syntrophobacterales bacterium CG_4_8_14_3_um_filter_49_14]